MACGRRGRGGEGDARLGTHRGGGHAPARQSPQSARGVPRVHGHDALVCSAIPFRTFRLPIAPCRSPFDMATLRLDLSRVLDTFRSP